MTLETNYAVAIATPRDWLKKSRASFWTNKEVNQYNRALYLRYFSRALSNLQEIAGKSDWFIAMCAPVIAWSNFFFGIGILKVIWKLL